MGSFVLLATSWSYLGNLILLTSFFQGYDPEKVFKEGIVSGVQLVSFLSFLHFNLVVFGKFS